MKPWLLLPLTVLGCARNQVVSRLPDHVSVSLPVRVYGVQCLGNQGARRLCAVILDQAEKTASVPGAAAVSNTINGSTVSTTTWFSQPQQVPRRPFTLISHNGSRRVESDRKVLYYNHHAQYGGPDVPEGAEQGLVGYVVDEYGGWAIEGEHSSVRYFDATGYWDVAGEVAEHPDLVPPQDLAWQRTAPQARHIVRAEFRDEFADGYRIDGYVTARIEQNVQGKGRWVSFAYFVDGKLRGEYPLTTGGPPRGILVIAGSAKWVFAESGT